MCKKGVPPQNLEVVITKQIPRRNEDLPMYTIRRESMFSLEQLLEMTPYLRTIMKRSRLSAPERLNYQAMIYSLFIQIVERCPLSRISLHSYGKNLRSHDNNKTSPTILWVLQEVLGYKVYDNVLAAKRLVYNIGNERIYATQ